MVLGGCFQRSVSYFRGSDEVLFHGLGVLEEVKAVGPFSPFYSVVSSGFVWLRLVVFYGLIHLDGKGRTWDLGGR